MPQRLQVQRRSESQHQVSIGLLLSGNLLIGGENALSMIPEHGRAQDWKVHPQRL